MITKKKKKKNGIPVAAVLVNVSRCESGGLDYSVSRYRLQGPTSVQTRAQTKPAE